LFVVKAVGSFAVGQQVRVTFPYRSVWKQTFLVFVLPLLLMLASGLTAFSLARTAGAADLPATALAGVSAVTGMSAGFVVAVICERRFRKQLRDETEVEPIGEGQGVSENA
jgi:positive regulator of sigma E activity